MTTIDRKTYLMALGLFTMATAKMRQIEEAQRELCALLDLEFNSGTHVEDAIYAMGGGDLDDALKRQGIQVALE